MDIFISLESISQEIHRAILWKRMKLSWSLTNLCQAEDLSTVTQNFSAQFRLGKDEKSDSIRISKDNPCQGILAIPGPGPCARSSSSSSKAFVSSALFSLLRLSPDFWEVWQKREIRGKSCGLNNPGRAPESCIQWSYRICRYTGHSLVQSRGIALRMPPVPTSASK